MSSFKFFVMSTNFFKNVVFPDCSKPKITICYVSSYGYTKRIARALMDGIKSAEVDVELKVYDLQVDSMEEAKKDVASSQGILLGSPTILSDSLPQIYDVMSVLNPIINKSSF